MLRLEDITVVIPTYNQIDLLVRTISSLEMQSPDPSQFETVIVDDGSCDGTPQKLKQYRGRLNLRAICLPVNKGRSAARNAGIDAAGRSLILFLDGDCMATPDLIQGHIAAHSLPNRAVIGGVRYSVEYGSNGFTRYLETRGLLKKKTRGVTLPRYFLTGHASVERKALLDVGGFDESIEYGEDIDIGIRLGNSGIEVYGAPDLTVIHQHVRNIDAILVQMEQFGKLSLPRLIAKHPQLLDELKLRALVEGGPRQLLLRLGFNGIINSLLLWPTSRFSQFRFPSAVYSYLLYRAYATGYSWSLRKA